MPSVQDFRAKLHMLFARADAAGAQCVEISSRQLHIEVGGYPTPLHGMPTCCHTMYREMKHGDRIVSAPPKGKGATVVIRFALPR